MTKRRENNAYKIKKRKTWPNLINVPEKKNAFQKYGVSLDTAVTVSTLRIVSLF